MSQLLADRLTVWAMWRWRLSSVDEHICYRKRTKLQDFEQKFSKNFRRTASQSQSIFSDPHYFRRSAATTGLHTYM